MNTRKIFLLLFTVLGSLSSALENSEIPEIREEHPRLDLEQSRWEWLRENISAGGNAKENAGATAQEFAETFSKLQWYYYNEWLKSPEFYMEGENSNKWNFGWGRDGDLKMARLTAFLFQINSDELSDERCEFIASKYGPYLDSIEFDSFSDHDSLIPYEYPDRVMYRQAAVFQDDRSRYLVQKYAAVDSYVYNAADAGKSYNTEKLDRFERRLLYLKPDTHNVIEVRVRSLKSSP